MRALLLLCIFSIFSLHGEDKPTIMQTFVNRGNENPKSEKFDSVFEEETFPITFFEFSHFPIDENINFSITRQLLNLSQEEYFFKIKEDGQFEITKNGKTEISKHIAVSSRGFLPGESIICQFDCKHLLFKHEVTLIPNPILIKNESDKTILEAELVMLNPTNYVIKLPSLSKGEKVKMKSVSCKEILMHDFEYTCPFGYMPGVLGVDGGSAKLTLTTKANQKITVFLPWGTELTKYLLGKTRYNPNGSKKTEKKLKAI